MPPNEQAPPLLLSLLQAFYWCDESLQNYLRSRGWPEVTRPQSMVMANVVSGVGRPSDIARSMGVSRQAVHTTINQMIELGMLALKDDPNDRRMKVVTPTPLGETMRRDAQRAIRIMTEELSRRLGEERVAQAAELLADDWGPPLSFDPDV